MNKYPKVSVIIPTLNEEKNIVRCLKSIRQQNYKGKIETIVIDNFSTDKTITKVRTLASKIILAGPERSSQRNLGAKKASGKWLLFIDADMKLQPNVIKEAVNLTQSINQIIIAFPQIHIGKTFWGKSLALEQNCYQGKTYLTAARFFKKIDFLEIGGYDPNLTAGEDWDLTQRFLKKKFGLSLTMQSHIYHFEPDLALLKMLRKEIYYISFLDKYAKKHPKEVRAQSSISYRVLIWLKAWKQLIRHPLLTLTFLCYKFVVWLMWKFHIKFHLFRQL